MEAGNFLFLLGLSFTGCLPKKILPRLMTNLKLRSLNVTPVSLLKVNETEEKKTDIHVELVRKYGYWQAKTSNFLMVGKIHAIEGHLLHLF